MSGIPEDIKKAAADVVVALGIGGTVQLNPDGFMIRDAVSDAILAERIRCARIAKSAVVKSAIPGHPSRPIHGRIMIAREILGDANLFIETE